MFGNNRQHVNCLIIGMKRERKERETLTIRESGYKGRFAQFLNDFLFSESLKLN